MNLKESISGIYFTIVSILIALLKEPTKLRRLLPDIVYFIKTYQSFRKLNQTAETVIPRPIFFQRDIESKFDAHYVYQAWWATKKIIVAKPKLHIDIASNIGFITQLAAAISVEFHELNPPSISLPNLIPRSSDILSLPFKDNSVDSLSCLHVLEHIGLGRYGDKVDPDGFKKACSELARSLRPSGNLYITVPVGTERVEFNSQRILNPVDVISAFSGLTCIEFSLLDDKVNFYENAQIDAAKEQYYACGFFHFTKPDAEN